MTDITNIYFEKAILAHKDIVFEWLDHPHMKEFWDNSQEHRDDILKFMKGRVEPSDYFGGRIVYWVGYSDHEPFCFILTSEVLLEKNDPDLWVANISKTGKTYCIDFGIGNTQFLGKGFAAPTLSAFCEFFQSEIEKSADTFFIDPDESNPRAKHVYEKAGFKVVGDFDMSQGFFKGNKSYLMIKYL